MVIITTWWMKKNNDEWWKWKLSKWWLGNTFRRNPLSSAKLVDLHTSQPTSKEYSRAPLISIIVLRANASSVVSIMVRKIRRALPRPFHYDWDSKAPQSFAVSNALCRVRTNSKGDAKFWRLRWALPSYEGTSVLHLSLPRSFELPWGLLSSLEISQSPIPAVKL